VHQGFAGVRVKLDWTQNLAIRERQSGSPHVITASS
jgi:hypothetical protein